jgi:hypothetical protein
VLKEPGVRLKVWPVLSVTPSVSTKSTASIANLGKPVLLSIIFSLSRKLGFKGSMPPIETEHAHGIRTHFAHL